MAVSTPGNSGALAFSLGYIEALKGMRVKRLVRDRALTRAVASVLELCVYASLHPGLRRCSEDGDVATVRVLPGRTRRLLCDPGSATPRAARRLWPGMRAGRNGSAGVFFHLSSASKKPGNLLPRQPLTRQLVEIAGPAGVFFAAEQMQIAPGVEPGVVAVVEGDARRVIADRF